MFSIIVDGKPPAPPGCAQPAKPAVKSRREAPELPEGDGREENGVFELGGGEGTRGVSADRLAQGWNVCQLPGMHTRGFYIPIPPST